MQVDREWAKLTAEGEKLPSLQDQWEVLGSWFQDIYLLCSYLIKNFSSLQLANYRI